MSDVTTIEADVPERYADAVSTRLRRAADEDVVGRIWRKDGTLWAPEGTPEVTNRLGWLDIAEREREKLADYDAFAEGLRAEGYRDAVVLGMGGSSLAPEVFRQSFGRRDNGLTLHVLDSTHPAAGARGPQQHRPRPRADDRLVQERRDDRADVDVQGLPRAPGRRLALRRGHRPRLGPRGARDQARLPPALPRRPGHRRALQRAEPVRPRPGRRRGDQRAGDPGLRDRRRRGVPRRARQRRPVARLRARRARPPGPRQAHVRRRRAADQLRHLGRAAVGRVDRQAGHAASCRSPTSRCSRPTPTATTASSCTSRSTTPTTPPSSPRSGTPATR